MVDHLLTKKKKAWVAQFKPSVVMKGTPLHHNAVDAKRYQKGIDRLIDMMVAETEKQILRLFESDAAASHFAQDASISVSARVVSNQLQKQFDQLFNKKAQGLAGQMVDASKASSRSVLNSSLKELSGGLSLKTDIMTTQLSDVLTASTAESVGLIKLIPESYLNQVQGALMRSIATGNGLKELVPALQKYKDMTYKRSKMIALDQTRKTYTSINKARMESIGIKQAEWLHSGGSNHPRPTHVAMNGKTFDLAKGMYDSDVKEWIQAGQLPNCRCTMRPIISFDEGQPDAS